MIAPRFQVTCAEPYKLNGVCDYEDDDSEDACEDVLGRVSCGQRILRSELGIIRRGQLEGEPDPGFQHDEDFR